MNCIKQYAQVLDGVLSYPMYFTLRNVFRYNQSLVQINQTRTQYAITTTRATCTRTRTSSAIARGWRTC